MTIVTLQRPFYVTKGNAKRETRNTSFKILATEIETPSCYTARPNYTKSHEMRRYFK